MKLILRVENQSLGCYLKFIILINLFNLILPYSTYAELSDDIDWEEYMPSVCYGDLKYRLPKSVTDLNISVVVNAIYEISEERMEFGLQLDLYEFWRDPLFNIPITEENSNASAVLIPRKISDCIWKPDTIFQNAKEEKLYELTSPNLFYKLSFEKKSFAFLSRKSRHKLTVACAMNFKYYPMDTQKCSLEISLFHSRKHEVRLQWDNGLFSNIEIDDDETPVNFKVKRLPSTKSEFQYPGVSVVMEYLYCNFLFKRSLTASLFNIYVPSFLVVCLSMVSFWLDINAVPGRVTLGVTAILTLSTQIVQARSGLPVLDYMTAVDVWLLGCLIMVFLSLVEFTFANSFSRRKSSVETVQPARDMRKEGVTAWEKSFKKVDLCVKCRSEVKGSVENESDGMKLPKLKNVDVVKDNKWDRISRVVFPVFMVIFCCIYWFYFYYLSHR